MTSMHPACNALLAAYNDAMGVDLRMSMTYEAWLLNAHNAGLTADDLRLAVRTRLTFNLKSQGTGFMRGIMLHHFVRSEEDIAVTINEAAVLRAAARIRVMDTGKASVLRATHRPTELPQGEARAVSELPLIQALRRAAE